jgi:hypothetical protein
MNLSGWAAVAEIHMLSEDTGGAVIRRTLRMNW